MGASITIATSALNGVLLPRIADPKTLGEAETINEALEGGYVIGKADQIAYNVKGVLKSMVRSIAKDGNGRKIDSLFSIQPTIKGGLKDITDDVDRSKIRVVARARTLKDLRLDTSDWTISVEGSTGNINVNAISTGEKTGEIVVGEAVGINGFGLRMGEGDSISWSVPGTSASGTVDAALIDSDMTRITVGAAALAALNDPAYNGKRISWSLRIGNNRAVKTAVLVIA